ncbi:MarR family winged helix-turn-helix transcriptional regulator [Paenibacillus tarimensis]|uniref:MarR family winged helix-turn-helix transcriptional regulator n=1 Tax=Paenibacillus tarimensis TaxID=416012 RepID=UPI001F317B06|nr:MarR family transcriptional regulator [Paenibacillus tarimensis]MCF2944522.1 MarR family transcriptional regulator [Paenibacillus tarimensis]
MSHQDKLLDCWQMIRMSYKIWGTEWYKQNPSGLSITQVQLLELLDKEGRQKASQLAGALFITTGGFTGIADRLVKAGLVERVKDEQDRRTVYLELTEEGRQELVRVVEQRKELLNKLFGVLPEKDVNELQRMLNTFYEHYKNNIELQGRQ